MGHTCSYMDIHGQISSASVESKVGVWIIINHMKVDQQCHWGKRVTSYFICLNVPTFMILLPHTFHEPFISEKPGQAYHWHALGHFLEPNVGAFVLWVHESASRRPSWSCLQRFEFKYSYLSTMHRRFKPFINFFWFSDLTWALWTEIFLPHLVLRFSLDEW